MKKSYDATCDVMLWDENGWNGLGCWLMVWNGMGYYGMGWNTTRWGAIRHVVSSSFVSQ